MIERAPWVQYRDRDRKDGEKEPTFTVRCNDEELAMLDSSKKILRQPKARIIEIADKKPSKTKSVLRALREEPTPLEDATLSVAPWYPQGLDVVLWCHTDAFTPEEYLYEFGDGQKLTLAADNVYHTFPAEGEYEVTCTPKKGELLAKATLMVDVQVEE